MADPYFDNVVLLCRFDSSIVDESNSAHALAVTGSPIISSAQSVAGGSSLRNATTATNRANYIYTPSHSDFSWDGDFTIELWAYCTAQSQTYNAVMSTFQTDGLVGSFQFGRHSSGTVFAYVNDTTGYAPGSNAAGSFPLNTWTHLCLERSGSTVRVYVNGVVTVTFAGTATPVVGGSRIEIGCGDTSSTVSTTGSTSNRDFQGFLDEIRITKGVARYDGASFTPPSGDDFNEGEGGEVTFGEGRTTAAYRETMTADPHHVATTVAHRETVSVGNTVSSTVHYRETLLSRAEPATTAAYREALYSRAEPASSTIYREILRTTALARTGLRKRAANLTWDTLIELIEINTREIGGRFRQDPSWAEDHPLAGILRFSPNWARDELDAVKDKPISFREMLFWPSAILAEGFSWSIRDQLPRPTLTIADMAGSLLVEATNLDDLIGAKVTVWMTDVNFLDFIPGSDDPADPATGDAYGPEIFVVNRLMRADGYEMQFELISEIDLPSAIIPSRLMFRSSYPGLGRQT